MLTSSFLANFLLHNYKQVQQLLEELPFAIMALQSGKPAHEMDYHHHIEMEWEYLAARKSEPEEDAFACEYMSYLLVYEAAQ